MTRPAKQPGDVDPHSRVNKKWGYVQVTCPTCRGTGLYHYRQCGLCKGKKWIWAIP